MYLCRPTYKILSEYASLSLSLFHIFDFYFFHIFQFHFFILFFMYTSFYFHLCRPTYKTLKEFASFSHLHSENFCILTQIWKFSNLGETLSRFLAIWFLANQILHRRDFQSYYLDNQFIQNDHPFFNLTVILFESNLAGMRSRRCLPVPQTR